MHEVDYDLFYEDVQDLLAAQTGSDVRAIEQRRTERIAERVLAELEEDEEDWSPVVVGQAAS